MTRDEIFKELETAIRTQKEAEIRVEIAKFRLQFGAPQAFELETKPQKPTKPTKENGIEKFISERQDEMEPETIEFLRRIEVTPAEVCEFLEEIGEEKVPTPTTVTRRVKDGTYLPGPSNLKGRRVIDTLSVVKHHFFRSSCQLPSDIPTAHGRSLPPTKGSGAR